jgi:hypothetical protein
MGITANASRLEECAVHVVHAAGSGALVKVIDILGAEIEPLTQFLFDYCKSDVSSIWLGGEGIATTHGVEPPNAFWIGVPGASGVATSSTR